MRRLSLLLATLLACAALPAAAGAIYGGRPAARPYPHQAFVEGSGVCGGSLVAARYVVTAGHCVTGSGGVLLPASQVRVALGPTRRSQFTADHYYTVTRVIRHEQYDDGNYTAGAPDYDAAVLGLARPAPQERLTLPTPGDAALWAPGVRATVIGWGETAPGAFPDDLHEAQIRIRSDAECTSIFAPLTPPGGRNPFSAPTMVCAGGPDSGATCSGDSGGPLLAPHGAGWVLAGLTSWGAAQCDDVRYANVFAGAGDAPLNGWLRERVPRADFVASPAAPAPGQPVTFSSTSQNPYDAYTRFEWDLDGDGSFDDGTGPSVAHSFPAAGSHSVGLRASNDAGDNELARRDIVVGNASGRTTVAFDPSAGPVDVSEGRAAGLAVRLARSGSGLGRVGLDVTGTAERGTDYADGLPGTVELDDPSGAPSVRVRPIDDRRDEPAETVELALERPEGGLVVGDPARLAITILDDDLSMRVLRWRVRRGRLAVRVRARASGRLSARVARSGSRTALATGRRTVRRRGAITLTLRLTRAGRRALAGPRRVPRARIVVDYEGAAGRRQGVATGTLR